MKDVFVIVANARARQAIPVGRRTLAGKYSGGKTSCRVTLAEFLAPEVQGHLENGRLTITRFSSDDAARLWAEGGASAFATWAEEPPASPELSAPEESPLTEEVAPAPEAPPEGGEAADAGGESDVPQGDDDTGEGAPTPDDDPSSETGAGSPEASAEGSGAPAAWTEETLRALPWRGEGSLSSLAASLGVSGKTKDDFVAGILALQEAS